MRGDAGPVKQEWADGCPPIAAGRTLDATTTLVSVPPSPSAVTSGSAGADEVQ